MYEMFNMLIFYVRVVCVCVLLVMNGVCWDKHVKNC